MDVKERIDRLSEELIELQRAYYVDGSSPKSDLEYDALFDELVRLETEHPEYMRPDSPTQRVGSDLTSDFPEVEHSIPVLSLDKAYSAEAVLDWMNRSEVKAEGKLSFAEEEKIDGISMVLYYEDGLLARAVTRGNGHIGNDVTANIRTIHSVPLRLPEPINLAVRGEVYLPKADFEKLKDRYPQIANPRNLAAGTVRRQKSSEAAEVPLDIFCYEGFWEEGAAPSDHIEILSRLKKLGFRINPHLALFASSEAEARKRLDEAGLEGEGHSFDQLGEYLEKVTARRASLPYEIDGMVTKVCEMSVREAFGYTEHHPRWAIAYKFESPQAETKVLDVTVQVGRTGRITPVAELKAVALGGSTVKRATLHNQEYINTLELAIGDTVSVVKRGDVIPAVEEVLEKNEDGNATYVIPPTCPSCGSLLEQRGAHLFCPNRSCPDQVLGRISFYTGRDQMDMESIGPKAVQLLVENKLVEDVPDLYTCNFDSLQGIKGVGEKTIEQFKSAVKESLNRPFHTVLASLGLPEVGSKGAEILVRGGFDSMDKLLEAAERNDIEAFTRIPQVGEQSALLIINALKDPIMLERIERLRAAGLQFVEVREENSEKQIFQDQVWCVTGSFENFNPRSLAMKEVEKRGGRSVSSVTGKTTHLLVGRGGGSKRTQAEKLGVTIVTEREFLSLIGQNDEEKSEKTDSQGELF